MAARPRKKQHRALEGIPYLYYSEANGYQLVLVNGKRASLGRDRTRAMAIAREYNSQMRGTGDMVERLIQRSQSEGLSSPPLSVYIDKLGDRMKKERQLVKTTVDTLNNDLERARTFFTMPPEAITLETVNEYLETFHSGASANVYNRKISFLDRLFGYAMDESLMTDNPAARKMRRPKAEKQRQRLTLEAYKQIHDIAPLWLQTAMDLSLQTTHARLEISRIEYKLNKPQPNRCGIVWFRQPQDGIYGTLYIHRQKVKDQEAAHVAIPVGVKLKAIIDRSRDQLISPYVVHRLPERFTNAMSKQIKHRTQLVPNYISRQFSKYRDKTGLFDHLPQKKRPTFHEIRALAAYLFDQLGIDPQARMAHTDAKSTRVYTENHQQWVAVPHAEIQVD